MDDPPSPYEIAVAGAAEAAHDPDRAPGVATTATQAAGLRVVLVPGGTLQLKDDLSDLAKTSLLIVLGEVKIQILPNEPVTDAELNKWIDMIYDDGWQPGERCDPGDEKATTATAQNRSVTIGTLIESCEASPKQLGKARARNHAQRKFHRQAAPRADKWWRRVGSGRGVWCLAVRPTRR
jgi:hypothetical protein